MFIASQQELLKVARPLCESRAHEHQAMQGGKTPLVSAPQQGLPDVARVLCESRQIKTWRTRTA